MPDRLNSRADREKVEKARGLLLEVYNAHSHDRRAVDPLDRIIARLEAWQRAHTEAR